MKFIISEDKIYDLVIRHLNNIFDVENINWTYAIDDWGNEIDAVNFYEGDFGDGEDLFKWYDKGYWESDVIDPYYSNDNLKKWVEQSPILSFDDNEKKELLDNIFGDRWHQPFKDWFMKNFGFPIKTIK